MMSSFNRKAMVVISLSVIVAVAAFLFNNRSRSTKEPNQGLKIGLPRIPKILRLDALSTIEDYEVLSKIHASLVTTDHAGRIYPSVARKWAVTQNGRVMTFELRRDLNFASGRKFSCDDVVRTYEYLRANKENSLW